MNLWKSTLLRLVLMSPDSFLLFRHLCNWVLIVSVFTQIIGYGSRWSHSWWGRIVMFPAGIVAGQLPDGWSETWQRNSEIVRSNFGKDKKDILPATDKWWGYSLSAIFAVCYGFGFIGLAPMIMRCAARSLQKDYQKLYSNFWRKRLSRA